MTNGSSMIFISNDHWMDCPIVHHDFHQVLAAENLSILGPKMSLFWIRLIPFWECFSSFGVLVGCWFWSYATQEMHAVSLERIAWWMEAYQDRCTEKTEETPANGHEYSIGYHHSQLSRRVGWNGCRPKSGWEINVSCCVCFFQFGGEEKESSKPIFHLELCVFFPPRVDC